MDLKARMAEIVAKLAELNEMEEFDAETVTIVNGLTSEYEDLKIKIEAK
jgi:hypothetical protein